MQCNRWREITAIWSTQSKERLLLSCWILPEWQAAFCPRKYNANECGNTMYTNVEIQCIQMLRYNVYKCWNVVYTNVKIQCIQMWKYIVSIWKYNVFKCWKKLYEKCRNTICANVQAKGTLSTFEIISLTTYQWFKILRN